MITNTTVKKKNHMSMIYAKEDELIAKSNAKLNAVRTH